MGSKRFSFWILIVAVFLSGWGRGQCQIDCKLIGPAKLQWEASANADGYRIYRRLGTETFDFNLPLGTSSTTTFTDSLDVPAWEQYGYVVTAFAQGIDGVLESGPSNQVTVIKVGAPPPPANLSIPQEQIAAWIRKLEEFDKIHASIGGIYNGMRNQVLDWRRAGLVDSAWALDAADRMQWARQANSHAQGHNKDVERSLRPIR